MPLLQEKEEEEGLKTEEVEVVLPLLLLQGLGKELVERHLLISSKRHGRRGQLQQTSPPNLNPCESHARGMIA
jgi:hypothetical protein